MSRCIFIQNGALATILKDNKDYADYESLNRFKYLNVFDKTYIKNSNGIARIRLLLLLV